MYKAQSWNCCLSYYEGQDDILMKTCAISASDALISAPATLRCGVKTRGQVQTHMPCPDTWQELQIYFIKHLAKACLKERLGQKSALLLAEFLQVLTTAEGALGAKQMAWHIVSFSLWPESVTEYFPGTKIWNCHKENWTLSVWNDITSSSFAKSNTTSFILA